MKCLAVSLLLLFSWACAPGTRNRPVSAGKPPPRAEVYPEIISWKEFSARRDAGGVDLIDVRMPADYMALHLVGARNVPFNLITSAGVPKERRIALYCSGSQCGLAEGAARALLAAGYPRVAVLEGGLEGAMAAGAFYEGSAAAARGPRLGGAELADLLVSGTPHSLVDTRPAAAFVAAHIPGAVNLPLEELRAGAAAPLKTGVKTVVYDSSDGRGAAAAALLRKAGAEVLELSGGFPLWVGEGRPVVNSVSR